MNPAQRPRKMAVPPFRWMLLALALVLPACVANGHLNVLGYTSKPNYDTSVSKVRVPIFRNPTLWTVTPVPGMEADLTDAVVREIHLRTPYRVVKDGADSELVGAIVSFTKTPLNYSQLNYPREVETVLVVDLVWRRLPDGELLSRPARRFGQPRPNDRPTPLFPEDDVGLSRIDNSFARAGVPGIPSMPSNPSSPAGPLLDPFGPVTKPDGSPLPRSAGREKAIPITLRSIGHYRPELGESITTAVKQNVDRMAIRITEAMEQGW